MTRGVPPPAGTDQIRGVAFAPDSPPAPVRRSPILPPRTSLAFPQGEGSARPPYDREMTYTVPFAIEFRAEMSQPEVSRIASELGMTFHSHPKLDLPFLAVAQFDEASGLFLLRASESRWRLECRTYGQPPAQVIDGWRARAAWVVGLIDPKVRTATIPRANGADE